jgi:hypothetical protein
MAELARRDAEADRERKGRAWRSSPGRQRYAARDSAWCEAARVEAQQAEAAIRGYMLAPGAPRRDAFPVLWTCSERQFERWASEEMKYWRAFDAHRSRAGATTCVTPPGRAPVTTRGTTLNGRRSRGYTDHRACPRGSARSGSARARRRDSGARCTAGGTRDRAPEPAARREERAGGPGAVEALRECDCDQPGGNRGRREQGQQY